MSDHVAAESAARALGDAIRSRVPIDLRAHCDGDVVVVRIRLPRDARELAEWIAAGGDECDGSMHEWEF